MSHQQSELEMVDNDIAELKYLQSIAKRNNVVSLLSREIETLEHKWSTLVHRESLHGQPVTSTDQQMTAVSPAAVSTSVQELPIVKLQTYAWDQSDKFVKIYVTINGVEDVPSDHVKCDFSFRHFELNTRNIKGKNYQLVVKGLLYQIVPDKSYVKIKKDTVLIMMQKEKSGQNWSCVTEQEQRSKDKKYDGLKNDAKDEDPSSGLMNLMKKMYDEGDDEMKRTIKKAWCEAQDKKKDAPGEADSMDF